METYAIDTIEPAMGIHNTLMEIKAELSDNDSPKTVKQFSDQLLHMLQELQKAQAEHEAVNKRMTAQCFEEAQFRQKEIQDAQNSYNAASSSLSKCQASLHAAKENLPNLEKAKKDYEDELKKKTDERNQQNQLYLQRKKDWQEAILFLDEFIKMVETKLGKYPTSFADLSEKLLRHTSKLGLVAEAVPILVALAQTPEEGASVPTAHNNYSYVANGKTVGGLKGQLGGLRNRLAMDSKQNDLNEEAAVKLFNELKSKLMGIISGLAGDILRTQKQITEMNTCVAAETAVITSSGNKLNRNKTLMNSAGNTCLDFSKEFINATNNRVQEINTVQTIIQICAKRFGEMPGDLVKYLDQVQNQFNAYVNSTVFKQYVTYVQKNMNDSSHGRALSGNGPAKPKNALKKSF